MTYNLPSLAKYRFQITYLYRRYRDVGLRVSHHYSPDVNWSGDFPLAVTCLKSEFSQRPAPVGQLGVNPFPDSLRVWTTRPGSMSVMAIFRHH
jgi:hypothetical protein